MPPEQSLREGNLAQALSELQAQVRKEPASSKHRVFLFQLLCVLGDWDRALTQLQVAGEMDAGTLAMVQTYREALRCEALRAQVFGGRHSPLLFGQPEQWLAELIEALRLHAAGSPQQAQALRERAFEAAPATAGVIEVAAGDGTREQPFAWIADADMRLGPVLEAIVNGRYYWIPFQRLSRLQIEAPADLRDVVWMPAQLTLANGGQVVALLPTRYPGTEKSGDDQLRLARRTEWQQADETFCGLGQRVLTTDDGEFGLMDIRSLRLESAAGEAEVDG